MAGPVIRTETYNHLLTSTARKMLSAEIQDQISSSNKLVNWMKMNNRVRMVNGGERITVPLMFEHNPSADIFQSYGQLDTTPPDGHTQTFWPWSQMAVTISISGLERRKNQGTSQILNLLQNKMDQARATATELLSENLVMGRIRNGVSGSLSQFERRKGRMDPSALGPYPIPALIDANPSRSVSIGDINGSTDAYWRNRAIASTATTLDGFRQEKLRLYMQCERGVGGPPDLVLCDERTWQLYFNGLELKERYMVTDQQKIDVLGGSRDSMIMYRNAIQVWDEDVPDVGTTTATPEALYEAEVGSYLANGANGTEYHINTNAMQLAVHPQANWQMTDFVKPHNQDASTATMLWQGQLCVLHRRKLGVLYDINNTIAS